MENKFYKQQGDEYIVKRHLTVPIIALLFFVSLGVYFFIDRTKHDKIPYYVFTFIPIGIYLYELGRTARINVANKTVSENWFSIKLSTYHFNSFARYILIKKTVNLINAGHGVSMGFKTAGKEEKVIAFTTLKNKAVAEEFIAETQRLMK